ncbi:MAG: hypothetical protein L6437_07815 [Kiritimatiellae bacterium]|nr:hypothetical protein [Kiritimatiellia bacterium]
MSVLLIIKLKQIIYSGENIGDDMSFQFDVKGQITRAKTRISSGQHKSFNKVLFQGTFAEGSVSLPIGVVITERDPVFHDTGSGSSIFNVQLQETETQTHSFNASVIASGGDKGKIATFTFVMEANISAIKIEITAPDAGQTFFIDSTPEMPAIDFVAVTEPPGQVPAGASIDWNIEIIYADHSIAAQGAIDILTATGNSVPGATFSQTFDKLIGDTGETSPGGTVSRCRASATLKVGGENLCSHIVEFHVRGENPTTAEINQVLTSVTGQGPKLEGDIRLVTMPAGTVQSVAQKESGKKQFRSDGAPVLGVAEISHWAKRGDRGIMQINAQHGNITTYAWNWKENAAQGKFLLKDAIRQSIQNVSNLRTAYPSLPDLTDKQYLQNSLSIFNSGKYYWSPNNTNDRWIPNPNNPKGRSYADSILP